MIISLFIVSGSEYRCCFYYFILTSGIHEKYAFVGFLKEILRTCLHVYPPGQFWPNTSEVSILYICYMLKVGFKVGFVHEKCRGYNIGIFMEFLYLPMFSSCHTLNPLICYPCVPFTLITRFSRCIGYAMFLSHPFTLGIVFFFIYSDYF